MSAIPQANTLFEQGVAACRAGQVQRGVGLFSAAINADPQNPELLNQIAFVMSSGGAIDAARQILIISTQKFPSHASSFNNLGSLLYHAGDVEGAKRNWNEALRLAPALNPARLNLATLHQRLGQLDRASGLLADYLNRDDASIEVRLSLGYMLRDQGRLDEAIASFQRVAELRPDDPRGHSAALYTLWFHDRIARREIVQRHIAWAARHADPLTASAAAHENVRDPQRRLRVAYIGLFARDHVVSLLCEPIFAHHDRAQFELFAYCTSPADQSHESKLRALIDHWVQCDRLNDADLAAAIRRDRIDILVDINTHMARPRVMTLARKPAPVQMCHLSYPATTGMKAIDYRVTCPQLDPIGCEEPLEPERLLRLPHSFWCYPTGDDIAIDAPANDGSSRAITFGCINSFVKVRDDCLRVWARILNEVPDSRLAMLVHGGPGGEWARQRLIAAGIDPARLDLLGYVSRREHLGRFNRIDVSVDPFPYGGHVSTLDSLWMGVPVIAMNGDSPVSRAGSCILSHVGLADLIASSPDDYVRLAVQCAADVERRALLRRELRSRMLASPLTDAASYVRDLETGYRAAWKRWCAGLSPNDIETAAEDPS